jgi:hypothetical protein
MRNEEVTIHTPPVIAASEPQSPPVKRIIQGIPGQARNDEGVLWVFRIPCEL